MMWRMPLRTLVTPGVLATVQRDFLGKDSFRLSSGSKGLITSFISESFLALFWEASIRMTFKRATSSGTYLSRQDCQICSSSFRPEKCWVSSWNIRFTYGEIVCDSI